MTARRIVAVLVLLSLFSFAAGIPESLQDRGRRKSDGLPAFPMKTTTVAAFKNGLGFVIKEGSGTLERGQGRIPGVPRATLGSLWLSPTNPSATLEELVAYRYAVPKYRPANSLVEMLQNNIGRNLSLTYNGKQYSGELLNITEPPPPRDDASSAHVLALAGSFAPPPYTSRLLLLKTGEGTVAMNADGVTQVSMPGMPAVTVTENAEETALRFRLKNSPSDARLTMGYLQEGIGWTPSYLVRLKDDTTAQITMQAVLVNDVEDLQEADVYFVVGAPNFAFADRLSPMALQQSLVDFIGREGMRRNERNAFSNVVVTGQAVGGLTGDEFGPSLMASVSDLAGSPEQDMFLYSLPKITLARGERGSYNVFSADIPYEHLYEWQVENQRTIDVYGNASNEYNQPASDHQVKDPVWHSLVLKNTSRFPWTSAPAMVLSSDRPVAQDAIRYTPKGAPGHLKLTVATDVRTSKKEVEVERKTRAAQFYGNYYDVVTVEGTLKLTNYKREAIRIQIGKQMIGSILTAGDNGRVEKTAEELRGVNPHSRITWELPLAPGVEKTIVYRYQVYVRG